MFNVDRTISLDFKDEPILIFGGAYSNLAATETLKTWAEKNGFSQDRVICTGDIIAYCAHPKETAELIKEWGVHCIQGNVEQSLAANLDDCGCGFEEGTLCDVLSGHWYAHAQAQTTTELRDWFAHMPQYLSFNYLSKKITVVHGARSDISRFIYPSNADTVFHEEFELAQTDIVVSGHSGLPFTKFLQSETVQRVWHNSGALGMPANDGTARVWFSVLENDNGHPSFTHHALEYDYISEQSAMRSKGLIQGYDKTLSNGLWPSMNVLPEQERRCVGKTISFD